MGYSPEELYNLHNEATSDSGDTPPYDSILNSGSGYATPDQSNAPSLANPPGRYSHVLQGDLTPPQGSPPASGGLLTPPTDISQGGKTGFSLGGSNSVSFKGTPDAKIDRRDAELNKTIAASDEGVKKFYQPALQNYANANQSAHDAAADATSAAIDKTTEEGRQAQVLSDVQKGFMSTEMKINALSSAKEEQMKGDYAAALADFRASRPDPNQFFDNMGGGVRFGTLVTAFAHDFLGAQGIKTSAMDTLKQGIERNMDAQIQAIKIKGEALQGFKTLWEMQRAQSASDTEARTRVRGFMMEMTKQGLISEMSKYDSALVSAQGKQALAKLDGEYAKNVVDVYDHIANNMTQLRGQAIQWAGDKLKADAQNYATATSARIHEEQMAAERMKEMRKAQQMEFGSLVPDTSASGGGVMKWRLRPGVGVDENGKVTELGKAALEKVAQTATMTDNVEEYRKMLREYDSIPDPLAKTRFADTNAQKMRELQLKIVSDDTLRRTGKAATDQERATYESRLPLNLWTTRGDAETVASGFEQHGIEDLNRELGTVAQKLTPEEIKHYSDIGYKGFSGTTGGFAETERLDAKNTHANNGKITDTPIDTANKLTSLPKEAKFDTTSGDDSVLASKVIGKPPVEDWKKWLESYAVNPTAPDEGVGEKNMRDQFIADHKLTGGMVDKKFVQPPNVVTGIEMLAAQAAQGNKESLDQLRQWANIGGGIQTTLPNGVDPNSNDGKVLRSFALYEFSKLDRDKQGGPSTPQPGFEEDIH